MMTMKIMITTTTTSTITVDNRRNKAVNAAKLATERGLRIYSCTLRGHGSQVGIH